MPAPLRRVVAASVVLALSAAGCGGGGRDGDSVSVSTTMPDQAGPLTISAQVASYDLSIDRDLRVVVGLQATNTSKLVSFGTVQLSFAYLGTTQQPVEGPPLREPVLGRFQLISGQTVSPDGPGPRLAEPSEGVGVYAADMHFDRAGNWGVAVTAIIDGKPVKAESTFEVRATPGVPVPGSDAPRSENHLPGAAGVPAVAVDSRAGEDGSVPDPELHATTVAAAIAAGRPTMVVVSTPVYCESRFCGPVTDSVQKLAQAHGDAMSFVHIEVWRDFEAQTVNKAAAEWIVPKEGTSHPAEPWVFVVGRDGKVVKRFDNVAGDDELAAAVSEALAA